jgi:hypothetical protein
MKNHPQEPARGSAGVSSGLGGAGLAVAGGLSVRAVAYLERGAVTTPQRETVRLLAGGAGPGRCGPGGVRGGRAGPGRAGRGGGGDADTWAKPTL